MRAEIWGGRAVVTAIATGGILLTVAGYLPSDYTVPGFIDAVELAGRN